MTKEFLEPGDPGYAEAKAKREARWASREAEQQKELKADTNTKSKTNGDNVEDKAPNAPLFKSGIGKKIASTLTKAGDKAEELRAKKQYFDTQLNRITGGPKPKPKHRAAQNSIRSYRTPLRVVSHIQKPASYRDSLADLIHGNNYEQPERRNMMSDLIGGDSMSNTSSHANDLIFGKPKKKNGKRNDPFGGLLG